jgi:GNAT superfamily N-acetyltransferase
MKVRMATDGDVPRLVEAWNGVLHHDQTSPERFRSVILGDPNYEPEGVVLAEGEGGEVFGLAAAVVRREVAGRDGAGSKWEFPRGFLKAFFVAEGEAGDRAADPLLAQAEDYCRAAGKRVLMVTEYAGPHLFPGIDIRYQRLREILVSHGYQDAGTIEDVAADPRAPRFQTMLEQTWAGMASDVTVVTWKPSLLPAMRAFVSEGNMPQWFPVGWEQRYQESRDHTLILQKGGEILGWAQYGAGRPNTGFGPILVLPRARGNDYGALLLLECMVRARKQGSETMLAGWANTGFYARYGWQIVRRYAVFGKEL